MRIPLVSDFLPDVTQQIHSLRASGVISAHAILAALEEVRAFRKSAGTLCTAPMSMSFLTIRLLYQILTGGVYLKISLPAACLTAVRAGRAGRAGMFGGSGKLLSLKNSDTLTELPR